MNGLLKSRKFWLAVWALIQTVAGHYINLPTDIIAALDAVVITLIAAIAAEDIGKANRAKVEPPQ